MAKMKISAEAFYQKTGKPTQKKQREAARITDLLFSEILPYTSQKRLLSRLHPNITDQTIPTNKNLNKRRRTTQWTTTHSHLT